MMNAAPRRWLLMSLAVVALTLTQQDQSRAQVPEGTDLSIELVDPNVFRVCADPRNLPFSNEKGEGFENKLAELFAEKLQKKLDYMYFPQATGFVKMTLGAHRCDVIMGFPARRRSGAGHQSLLPHCLRAGRQAGQRPRRRHDA